MRGGGFGEFVETAVHVLLCKVLYTLQRMMNQLITHDFCGRKKILNHYLNGWGRRRLRFLTSFTNNFTCKWSVSTDWCMNKCSIKSFPKPLPLLAYYNSFEFLG